MHAKCIIDLFAIQEKNAVLKSRPYKYGHDRTKHPDFCTDSTPILPGVLLKNCPDSARIFTKMSSDEELVTLVYI